MIIKNFKIDMKIVKVLLTKFVEESINTEKLKRVTTQS